MLWPAIAFVLLFSLLPASLLVVAMRRKRPRLDEAAGDRAGSFAFFFLLLFMLTWAGGLWLPPFGPTLWGAAWLPYLMVAMVAMLAVAVLGEARRVEGGGERDEPPGTPSIIAGPGARLRRQHWTPAALHGFGAFYWTVLLSLALAVVSYYLTLGRAGGTHG